MKQLFVISATMLWANTICSADLPEKKEEKTQYVYLAFDAQEPKNKVVLTISPHKIYDYLLSQACEIRNQKVHYYKLPAALLQHSSARYVEYQDHYPCDWGKYRENKRLTTKQEDALFFNGWVRPTIEKESQKSVLEILFRAFRQISFDEKTVRIKVAGYSVRSWATGEKV